jgi:hypothetical protein
MNLIFIPAVSGGAFQGGKNISQKIPSPEILLGSNVFFDPLLDPIRKMQEFNTHAPAQMPAFLPISIGPNYFTSHFDRLPPVGQLEFQRELLPQLHRVGRPNERPSRTQLIG